MKEINPIVPSVIREAEYEERIHEEVEPWCKSRLHRGHLTSYDGTMLQYYYALNPTARGTIVVVHGFCEFIAKYRELLYTFYQAGYNVFFHEQRGHGRSQRRAKDNAFIYVRSFEEYVKDLKWLLDKKILPLLEENETDDDDVVQPLFLFAHSMGGAVASLFLEEYPEYFDAAVLSSPMHRMFTGMKQWQALGLTSGARLLRLGKRAAPGQGGFDPDESFENSCSLSPARFRYVLEQRRLHPQYQTGGATFGWINAGLRAGRKAIANAGKVEAPVLILQAGQDTLVDIKAHEEFAEGAEDVTVLCFNEAKHELMNGTDEIVAQFYTVILGFFHEQYEALN